MRILDRYIVRETLVPFLMALAIFTFLLAVRPVMDEAEKLLAKSVPPQTIGVLLAYLLPQALGITIPMALLAGLLMAFGRLSSDRETVALLACGVSMPRLLRPVAIMATIAAAATLWVMVVAIPTGNRQYLQITFDLLQQKMESEIQPRVFFTAFPGKVLYIQDVRQTGAWGRVFIGDTSNPGRPRIQMAREGRLAINRERRLVDIVLVDGYQYAPGPAGTENESAYDVSRFQPRPPNIAGTLVHKLDSQSVFGTPTSVAGQPNSMTMPELWAKIAEKQAIGMSPHPEVIAIQQKFSFPVACYVLGVIALAVGMHTRREGKFAAFTVGIAVIFVYYAVMFVFENLTKSQHFPAIWARWVPNIVLGLVGLGLLWRQTRGARARRRMPSMGAWMRRLAGARRPAPAAAGAAGTAAPRRRGVVVVVKVPELALPRPTLLDLYVGNRYLRVLALTFFGLIGLFYISTFIELSERLLKGDATSGQLVAYMVYMAPEFVYYVVPIAVLLAALVTIGILTKTSELTIMRACGVSLYRATAPLLLLGLLAGGFLFLVQEKALARGRIQAERINREIRKQPPKGIQLVRGWKGGRAGQIYHYDLFNPRAKELDGLTIYELDAESWRLVRQTYVPKARFRNGAWQADAGWVQRFPAAGPTVREPRPAGPMPELEPPDYFGTESLEAPKMNLRQLQHYITDLDASGADASDARVEYHSKIAFPLVTVIMTLIAIPFAVTTGRRGALYGIGLGIALSIAYWFILTIFGAMGTAGLLPPVLAAWAPNLFFAAGALYLLLTVRT